jgi:hypothetical protein
LVIRTRTDPHDILSLVGNLPKAGWQFSRSDTMLAAGPAHNLSLVMPKPIPWNSQVSIVMRLTRIENPHDEATSKNRLGIFPIFKTSSQTFSGLRA